jgi:predicted nucleic acid-binding Zn ribbon protein
MARMVHCLGCHAEISDDRKACPHCSTEVVSEESKRDRLMAENARLSLQLEAATADLEKQNAVLAAKLASVKASKAEAEA